MVHQHHGDHAAPQTEGKLIRWANRYDLTVQMISLGRAGRLRRLTAQRVGARVGDAVLDVGCGTGDLTFLLARQVGPTGAVSAIDASPEMIDLARQKATRRRLAIDFRLEPVESMTFAEQSFDRAVSSMVFHHLPGELQTQALRAIARVLKPGGSFLIVDMGLRGMPVHNVLARHLGGSAHAHGPIAPDLGVKLREAGFIDIAQAPLGMQSLICMTARIPG